MKIARSASGSESISQRHGFAGPDPQQNVMDPQHWSYPLPPAWSSPFSLSDCSVLQILCQEGRDRSRIRIRVTESRKIVPDPDSTPGQKFRLRINETLNLGSYRILAPVSTSFYMVQSCSLGGRVPARGSRRPGQQWSGLLAPMVSKSSFFISNQTSDICAPDWNKLVKIRGRRLKYEAVIWIWVPFGSGCSLGSRSRSLSGIRIRIQAGQNGPQIKQKRKKSDVLLLKNSLEGWWYEGNLQYFLLRLILVLPAPPLPPLLLCRQLRHFFVYNFFSFIKIRSGSWFSRKSGSGSGII